MEMDIEQAGLVNSFEAIFEFRFIVRPSRDVNSFFYVNFFFRLQIGIIIHFFLAHLSYLLLLSGCVGRFRRASCLPHKHTQYHSTIRYYSVVIKRLKNKLEYFSNKQQINIFFFLSYISVFVFRRSLARRIDHISHHITQLNETFLQRVAGAAETSDREK